MPESETVDTPSFRNIGHGSPSIAAENKKCKKEFEQIEDNISEVLVTIQGRRDKLRRDSLERKKLIDEVMSRKKELCGFGEGRSGGSGVQGMQREGNWRAEEERGYSQSKYQNKSYLR